MRRRTWRAALLALLPAPAAGAGFEVPRTFGAGIVETLRNASFQPVTVLEHRLADDAAYGVVSHFWTTGEIVNDQIVLDYFVDGEASPSISMQPALASGQGFPRQRGNFGGGDLEPPYSVFSAGGKMGKAGHIGSWYNYHRVLFRRQILITARTLDSDQLAYLNVRGYEVPQGSSAAAGLQLPSGFVVPPHAKLQLMRIDNVVHKPLDFVPLVSLAPGYAGLLYLTSLAVTTSPAGNDYIEGCWHLYTDLNQPFPGVVLGTGLEDYFDSAYWFCALNGHPPCRFAQPASGVLHFSRKWPNGTEMSSEEQATPRPYPAGTIEEVGAYRFFDSEVVGFRDGGALHWRVGDVSRKCSVQSSPTLGAPASVALRAYAWVYTWPLDPGAPPAPNSPPLVEDDPQVLGRALRPLIA